MFKVIIRSIVITALFAVVCTSLSAQYLAPKDTSYRVVKYRDSVNEYAGRLTAYHQEAFDYDFGMMLAFIPVAGEAYVGNTTKGIVYFGERFLSVGVATVGVIRLIGAKQPVALNIGLLAAGIIGYVYFKLSELSDVAHQVSYKNESLIEQFHIAEADVIPGSIRYPTKQWPDWVTARPEARHPQNAREAIDKPLPSSQEQLLRLDFQIPF